LKTFKQPLDLLKFNYLKSNPNPIVATIDDKKWFADIQMSFYTLNFTKPE
jgi:hypothetical protein